MIEKADIEGLLVITPARHEDDRGFFSETYNAANLRAAGFDKPLVQDNQSYSKHKGVVRGLHFQTPPSAQDKLVRVLRGSIVDVAVDLRVKSPTYGQHFSLVLSASNWKQLFIPVGFAHGFCTLEDHTEIAYKVSENYAPAHDQGLRWDDPDLAIDWRLTGAPILSPKDAELPLFAEFSSPF